MWSPFRSPRWNEVVYWSIDLETTGFDPHADRILSVGMVPVRDGSIRHGERFYTLVRPGRDARLDTEAIRAHHILPGELDGAPSLAEALPEVNRRLGEGIPLVHYGRLDVGFLREAYRRAGRDWPHRRVVDTVDLLVALTKRGRFLDPGARPWPTSLVGARERLGLPPHRVHHALSDAIATAELFLALRSRLGARTLRNLL
jgi:DNA polymerase III subunit epsilon